MRPTSPPRHRMARWPSPPSRPWPTMPRPGTSRRREDNRRLEGRKSAAIPPGNHAMDLKPTQLGRVPESNKPATTITFGEGEVIGVVTRPNATGVVFTKLAGKPIFQVYLPSQFAV